MQRNQTRLILMAMILIVGCNKAPSSEPIPTAVMEPTTPPTAVSVDSTPLHPTAVTALVFVDENVNGRYDPAEPAIPNTLVVGQYNVAEAITRMGALTDESGTAVLEADYTDYFEVVVVPPCGFEATTAVNLSAYEADENGVLPFGFRPEDTKLGLAEIQVQLWQDAYADGVLQDEERPLVDTTVTFNPHLKKLDSNETYAGLLTAQTDENGVATASWGNSCGIVWVNPLVESGFTKIRPAAIYEEGQVGFEVANGRLEVRMGVSSQEVVPEPASITPHQFTFANGSPNHPEGFGEWQILLDSGGYFSLKHLVQDEETDYGVISLLPAENDRLWQLIEAVDLPSIPSSTGDALPDSVAYTFTLTASGEDHALTIWATEAQENEAMMALLAGLAEVVKAHTGKEAVLR